MRCALAAGLAGLVAATGCIEGGGDSGDRFVIERRPIEPNCTPVGNAFPSGLDLLPLGSNLASLAQFAPPSLLVLDLDGESPSPLAAHAIEADSDADGLEDGVENARVLGLPFPFPPTLGELSVVRDDLALVSTSDYEQVLVFDAEAARPRSVTLATPGDFDPRDYPLLPAPGGEAERTGISTLVCLFPPPPALDSEGDPIGAEPRCDPGVPGYFSRFTAGKALAAGRLFVATSNKGAGVRFRPGSVLVYTWSEAGGEIRVSPDPDEPVLFTRFFNPTGVRRVRTAGGRELVLVTTSGAIGSGTGAANVRGEGAVEVIDPSVPRWVAVIPLGRAGPSFDGSSADAGGRIAWLGSSSQRQLYAIDLRALDDPALYTGSGPPVALPGAVVFDADRPLALPDLDAGPDPAVCEGFTHAAPNAAASEVFATDFCDGTLTRVRMDLSLPAPIPWPQGRFTAVGQATPFAPSDAVGLLRAPGLVRVRPGEPGLDYSGPDVLVPAGQPDAQLCALRVESE